MTRAMRNGDARNGDTRAKATCNGDARAKATRNGDTRVRAMCKSVVLSKRQVIDSSEVTLTRRMFMSSSGVKVRF
jgi:hypothetical protein